MTERSWCPSLCAQPGIAGSPRSTKAGIRATGNFSSAKRDAAVAANNSVSAAQVAGTLAAAFQRRFHRFDAALVCSKANRALWPLFFGGAAPWDEDALLPPGAAVCLDVMAISQTPDASPSLALPSNLISDFLSLVARRSAERGERTGSESVSHLVALPPAETVASLGDIVSSLMSSKSVVEGLRGLVVCDASAAESGSALARLVGAAPKLEALTLAGCAIGNTVAALLEAVKATELKRLRLDRCDFGMGAADADREALSAALCEAVKVNKFLTSLSVSQASLDTDLVVALVDALAESDTKLLPEELGQDAEDITGWSLEGRVHKSTFLGRGAAEDGAGDDDDDDAANDDEDGTPLPGASDGDADEDDAADNEDEDEEGADADDDGGDDEVDEEDEEDEEDEKEEEPHASKAVKQRAAKERQERQERRAELKRIEAQLKELLRSEPRERGAVAVAYCQELQGVVSAGSAPIASRRAEERQQKKEAYCSRRSGWSRLESLVLRGNQVGDRGCKQLARMLRDEVPLSEDEVAQRHEAVGAVRDGFAESLGAARGCIVSEERKAWGALLQLAQHESPALVAARSTSVTAALSDADEEDEYAKEAPPVLLTNVERPPSGGDGAIDDGDGGGDGDGDDDDSAGGFTAEEQKEWQQWVSQSLPRIPVTSVKKGMDTVRVIDLGSCGIGSKGVAALAAVLKTNRVLETLSLRHNPIGASAPAKKSTPPEGRAAGVSGFAEFAEMLSVNGTLLHLDLGYCHLSASDVRAVAAAMHRNTSLAALGLEGNQLGVDEAYQQQAHTHSYLYELWMTASRPGSAMRHLNMDHNDVAACLWQEEAAALAAVCGQLTSLSLCRVGLQLRHLQAWSEALPPLDVSYSSPVRVLHLARNGFASEADGAALGMLLHHFVGLEELSLEEHPLLGSGGVAAALAYLPLTLQRLNCTGTGLTTPFVGAARNPVVPVAVAAQLTCLLLGDVEVPTVDDVAEWVSFVRAVAPQRLQFLSLWARGMVGMEDDIVPLLLALAQECPSLLHVDGGFQPQFYTPTRASACFEELERLLFSRRVRCAAPLQPSSGAVAGAAAA